MARELRGYLDAFIVDRCERFDRDKATAELRPLLALSTEGALWVFSTNYDRIVEFACEVNGIAWSDGFDTTAPTPVADWQGAFDKAVRVVKLHGSVNWYEDDAGGAPHRLDRGYSLRGHDFRLVSGDQRLRPLMIVPTLEKEALGDPYIGLAVKFTVCDDRFSADPEAFAGEFGNDGNPVTAMPGTGEAVNVLFLHLVLPSGLIRSWLCS